MPSLGRFVSPYFIYAVYILFGLAAIGINLIAINRCKFKWNLQIGIKIPAILLCLFLFLFGAPTYFFSDFMTAYYPAGRLVFEDPYGLYNLKVVFVNIPIIAFLCTPFSILPARLAILLLILVTCIIAILIYRLLLALTQVTGWRRTVLFCLLAINGPLIYSFKEGNSTHFALPLVLVALLCLRNKQEARAGVMLGIATLIKPFFLLLSIYFLLRQKWKVGIGFGLSILSIVGSSLLLFGVDIHKAWFNFCIRPYFGKVMPAFNNQSLDAFIARLISDVSLATWWPPIDLGWEFKLIRYLLLSCIVGVAIWVLWRASEPSKPEEENLEFCIVLCLAILINPISWTHYYLYLLIPLSLYLGNQLSFPQSKVLTAFMLFATFLISLPCVYVDSQNLVVRFLISYSFFGGIVLLGSLLVARWCSSKNPIVISNNHTHYNLH